MKNGLPLLLFALLLHAPAAAAQTRPEAAGAERERVELERKALGLVEEALAEAQSLKLLENRVHAQAAAARLLWPRDARAARAAFKAAADGVAELNAAVDPEDPQFYSSAMTVAQLRAELVNSAAPFDANLALEFLRATRPAHAEAFAAAGYGHPWQEHSLEMSVASNIAAQEPRKALELAEESLSRGVTGSHVNVVQQLRAKDQAAASKLAAAIVRRLRPEDLLGHGEAGSVAQQLLMLTRPADNPPANGAANSEGPTLVSVGGGVSNHEGAPLLDEQTRRALVEKVLAAASSGAPNQGGGYNLFQSLQAILPELERVAPARAAALRVKAEELERGFNPHVRQMRPYQDVINTGTVEGLLEAARKAPAGVRDQLYTQAAWKAFNEGGDADRARQILENLSNPQQRVQARREMETRAHWRAVQQGGYAEARQAAARLKTPEERAQALLQVASRAATDGEAEAARQLLEEARGLVETQTRGHQQFANRLQLAAAYAQFDAGAAFEVAESAVGRLDALLDAAEALDGFGQESFREGELKPQGSYMWNEMIGQCAQSLARLAREDFDRAASAAKRFRRPEARTNALLALARNLLEANAYRHNAGARIRTGRGNVIILN